MEHPLNIEDAKHLMEILDNDIPYLDKKNIAFLLLILASNLQLVEDGRQAVGVSPRTCHTMQDWGEYSDGDYCEYGC